MEASSIHRHQNIRNLKGLLHIENRTLRFKAFYFVFFFGCGTLRNYLPVYFRRIGLNAVLTGIITGVRPFTGFISAPVFSFLADKTGHYKAILLISLIISVLSYFSLSFVSIIRQVKDVPPTEYVNATSLEKKTHQLPGYEAELAFGGNFHSNSHNLSVYHRKFYDRNGKKEMEKNLEQHFNLTNQSMLGKTPEMGVLSSNSTNFKYDVNQNLDFQNDTAMLSETTIFFVSFALVILGDIFNAPVDAIMCSTIIYWEGSSQFGKQRVFGAIGFGLGSFLTGIAIDRTVGYNYFYSKPFGVTDSTDEHNPNYLTAFFLYLAINCLLLFFVSFGLDIVREKKSKIVFAHVRGILSRGMIICFLVYSFIIGVVGGTIMLFLFWFLENLGASQLLLGLSSAIMSLSEVPVFPLCTKMISSMGHIGVLSLSLTCSVIRLTCYSFLENPWYVLLIEPLHGITLAAMWSTSISFASAVSSPEVYTTMEGIITGFHYGLGWGLGALFGGMFFNLYGPRNLFRGCIVLCLVGYIFLALVYILRKREQTFSTQYARLDYNRKASFSINDDYDVISGETF